jgi:excisionase family DNA binding protein
MPSLSVVRQRKCLGAYVAVVQALIGWWEIESTDDLHEVVPMAKLTDYLQTAEAAEFIGVAQNTIRKWAQRGDIPMHRNPANGYRLFKRSDLERFLKNAAKPVSPAVLKKTR